MIWNTCDFCGQGGHVVHSNGAGYCSLACMNRAERSLRREDYERRNRQEAARDRQATLRLVLGLLCVFVGYCMICADQYHDEVVAKRIEVSQ